MGCYFASITNQQNTFHFSYENTFPLYADPFYLLAAKPIVTNKKNNPLPEIKVVVHTTTYPEPIRYRHENL